MNDLVDRLRFNADLAWGHANIDAGCMQEAADEIERLRARVVELKEQRNTEYRLRQLGERERMGWKHE